MPDSVYIIKLNLIISIYLYQHHEDTNKINIDQIDCFYISIEHHYEEFQKTLIRTFLLLF